MADTDTSELEELKARLAALEQTSNTRQGGTYPHSGILAGHPVHTILGPVDEAGHVLEGAWNTETGLWENPEEAEKNKKKAADDKAAAEQAARDQVQAANKAKAMEIARQQLADEADLAKQVEAEKATLRGPASPVTDKSA
jgi:hypothetical protein